MKPTTAIQNSASLFVLCVTWSACTTVTPPSEPTTGVGRPASERIAATDEAVEQAYIQLNRTERAIADTWRNRTFEDFEASVSREPDGGKYIVNGDTPIVDRKHLREFFEQNVQSPQPFQAELTVMSVGGVDVVWDDVRKRNLTYCVSTAFGSRHNQMVDAMTAAADAWERAADIDFIHASAQDNSCTANNNQVVLDVRPVTGASYLARAFFPNDPRSDRNVLVDDSSFNLDPNGNLTLMGILSHELGHTLGFRHEHTRPEAGTCFEDTNWRPLTNYDAFSTMHYPQCNGAGDWSLALTEGDESGAACLYGPAPGFTIDTNICTPPSPVPDPPCGSEKVVDSGQVEQGEQRSHGSFSVAPGSQFTVQMSGNGDPDLYVRFRQTPTLSNYDCRPFLTGATESCDLTVPVGAAQAFVMIRGYTPGNYNLTIEHTPNP